MKKLFLFFLAVTMLSVVSAQDSTKTKEKNPYQKEAPKKQVNKPTKPKDMVMMKNNKMMLMKDGVWEPMTKKFTTTNKIKVKIDGTMTKPDGTTMVMKNGDRIDIDGKIIIVAHPPESKPDSSMKK